MPVRVGSWAIFSGGGLPSLGQEGAMPSLLGAGEGPWIQGTVVAKSWLLQLLYQNIILSQKEENIIY